MSNFGSGSARDAADSTQHYDDAAFSYFLVSVLLLVLVPWTWSYIKAIRAAIEARSHPVQRLSAASAAADARAKGAEGLEFTGSNGPEGGKERAETRAATRKAGDCLCDGCIRKKRVSLGGSSAMTKTAIVKLVLYFFLVAMTALLIWGIMTAETTESAEPEEFDPYGILGIDTGATEQDIRKAYRRLSRESHPDKNPDDEEAAKKYLQLTKAKDTLTDPAVREKWEKYGNPDGPQAVTVGIALPSWLVNQDNSTFVLLFYVLLICVAVPAVALWYWRSQKELAGDVNVKTLRMYFDNVKLPKTTALLELLAASFEYSEEIKVDPLEEDALSELKKAIPAERQVIGKERKLDPYVKKGVTLLEAHISRVNDSLPESLRTDTDFLLSKQDRLLSAMFDVVCQRQNPRERLTMLSTAIEVLHLKQMISQAAWGESARREDMTFLQLPHMKDVLPTLMKELESKKWKQALAHAGYSLNKPPKDVTGEDSDEEAAASADKVVEAEDIEEDTNENEENPQSGPSAPKGAAARGGRGGKKGKRRRRPAAAASKQAQAAAPAEMTAPGEKSLPEIFVDILAASKSDTATQLTAKQRENLIADNHPKVIKASRHSLIRQFCLLTPEQRTELLQPLLSAEQMEDIESVIERLPRDVVFTPYMPPYVVIASEGEKDDWYTTPNAVATLVVTLSRPSMPQEDGLKSDGPPVPVHCPRFPHENDEVWYVILGDERGNRLMNVQKVVVRDQAEARMKIVLPDKASIFEFRVYVISDSYIGFDSDRVVRIRVNKESAEKGKGMFFDEEHDPTGAQSTLIKGSDSEDTETDEESSSESESSDSEYSE
jgi:preprotein translocase subunit Sec63